jgi:hypothetical protein
MGGPRRTDTQGHHPAVVRYGLEGGHLNSLLSCLNVDTMNRNLGSMLIIVDAIQVVAK